MSVAMSSSHGTHTALRTEKVRREHFTVNCSLETKLGIGVHEELGVFLASKFREFTTETNKQTTTHLITRSWSLPLRKALGTLISA